MMLRPFRTEEDIKEVYALSTREDITKMAGNWDRPVPFPLYAEAKKRTWGVSDNGFQLIITPGEESRDYAIGVVNVSDIDTFHRRATVGVMLDPRFQGKGYARKAMEKLVELCFTQYGLERLTAEIYPFNEASRCLFGKVGFAYEGKLLGYDYWNGKRQDVLVYGLNKAEWENWNK